MPIRYDHRQSATWLRVITLILGLFFVAMAIFVGIASSRPLAPVSVVILGGALAVFLTLIFSSMRVVVDDEAVSWSFGPGFPNYRLPLVEVRNAQVTRNSWFWGWGIRWTPAGWLYRVTGLSAVDIETSTKHVFLGSDEPELLCEAILVGRSRDNYS